jgi:hypothetical protein
MFEAFGDFDSRYMFELLRAHERRIALDDLGYGHELVARPIMRLLLEEIVGIPSTHNGGNP